MSDTDNKNNNPLERGPSKIVDSNIASPSEISSVTGSVKTSKTSQHKSSTSERQIKFERAQRCLENAALVSKRIKEHRKATAELLGRPFEEDDVADTASELASTMSEKTGYSVATDTSTTLSVQDALNIPGISESLANTLKQKELLMERIKQYKEISKRPMTKPTSQAVRRESTIDTKTEKKKTEDKVDVNQLLHAIKEKDNSLSVIQVKMKAMETTILDLQEKINEKDQIIEAKNKATTLMSDSLSKKDKDSLILLEDTRQQMTKMQENFIAMETEWKEEKHKLIKEIDVRDEKIHNLEEANSILEASRFEISKAHSKLVEELEIKNQEIKKLEQKIESLQIPIEVPSPKEKDDVEEEKGSLEIAGMVELTKKIELLEQLNCQIRQTNKELENKLANVNTDIKTPSTAAGKKGSPLPTRKGGRNTAMKAKSPWTQLSSESLPQETDKKGAKNEIARLEMLVQSLNKDILEKEYVISQKEAQILELQSANTQKEPMKSVDLVDIAVSTDASEDNKLVEEELAHKQEESNLESNPADVTESESVKELKEKLKIAEEQLETLRKDMETSNLNMIKVKSTHKLKLKQLQKSIDSFSQVSDSNAEVVRLQQELQELTRKVAVLEEEKGNLQLHLVDYDSGRLTDSEIYKKLTETEALSETRLKAISVLETQKFDLVQELHMLQQKNIEMEDKLADISQLQSEHVCSEMKSVQMEEQIDELTAAKKELELVIENLKLDKEHLHESINGLQVEKAELTQKLDNYIQENIELTDKLEKLSAEKVSSAESIEIVESLTTQEKLELEEYNKGMFEDKSTDQHGDQQDENVPLQSDKNIDSLIEQREELNKKIELFTQEREEVLEKMSKMREENESLLTQINELHSRNRYIQDSVQAVVNEKAFVDLLNQDLTNELLDLKRSRVEIVRETAEVPRPSRIESVRETAESARRSSEDNPDGVAVEVPQDDKVPGASGSKGAKTVKQLTKEILKLKNTIKEREDEIADCQMKILSLEEQQQKQNESLQSSATNENKIKSLTEENCQLKQELQNAKIDRETEQQFLQLKQAHDILQNELQKVHQEYSISVSARDARINELENVLLEYEKQIYSYGNSLQQKDKELSEYINQITKLNDVSQKLKSTIELLEEEKAKDQNAELVKTLNKQISVYQKKLLENEEKIKILEEERNQLHCMNGELVNKNANLESQLEKLNEKLSEKQALMKELQIQQQKHAEEMAAKKLQNIERDEEIHEIKLQLRKESIENEKLRNSVSEKETLLNDLTQQLNETKEIINQKSLEKDSSSDQLVVLETRNKELLEKLKKLAFGIKKKTALFAEQESIFNECQKQLQTKEEQIEQLVIQVETLPALQEKLKHADEEINRLLSHKVTLEQQRIQEINQLQGELNSLKEKSLLSSQEISQLTDSLNELQNNLHFAREENIHLKAQVDSLNNKLVEHEIEQKNNMNLLTKISSLETDINQKQLQISELLNNIEHLEQQQTQVQYGYNAKVQERDLYIENLETDTNKYKNRICRLEESISAMEDRRHSLERKADQLDSQLQEKHKAYTDYSSQEDELVTRLAALMDHDRVLEKQLLEIESENKELQYKVQHLHEDNQRLRKSLSDIQEHNNALLEKADKFDLAESENSKYQTQLRDLEANLKKITHEHQSLIVTKKQAIEELESEFNTQIENACKEKKILSEKCEKYHEYVSQLEATVQEYKNNIETLNINIEELNRINKEIAEKSNTQESVTPDYTEQYINEINRLNSVVNSKSNEISELNNKIQAQLNNNVAVVSNFESKISELTVKLNETYLQVEQLGSDTNSLQLSNELLQKELHQKEEQIKELIDNKKLTFEMNIPKTEGMIISSTIEPMNEDSSTVNISSIESQIVSSIEEPVVDKKHVHIKVTETLAKQSASGQIEEQIISPKKAYLCYTNEKDDNVPVEIDPFNSDEGWGLGETEEVGEFTPGVSYLNKQIDQYKKENEALKADLETNNTKLLKALKKLKELKTSNDMLNNEIKTAKQMSQTAFFDHAVEDELRSNIQDLEKKIEELSADIAKEKRDKESLRKQNEVFHNANDRLTEMKEKLDTEIQVWKYKFKEANDKISTLQWGGESKDPTETHPSYHSKMDESKFKDELNKVEKENEELHAMVDQLKISNQELLSKEIMLQNKISSLHELLQQHKETCDNCVVYRNQIEELGTNNIKLSEKNELLVERLQYIELQHKEVLEKCDNIGPQYESMIKQLENQKLALLNKISDLEEAVIELENEKIEISDKYTNLQKELSEIKESESNRVELLDKNNKLEEVLRSLEKERMELLDKNYHLEEKIISVEQDEKAYQELVEKCSQLEHKVDEVNHLYSEAKLQIASLLSELESIKLKSSNFENNSNIYQNIDNFMSAERSSSMEPNLLQLERSLGEANTNVLHLQSEREELLQKSKEYEDRINELNLKIQNLNAENDNLLSTVAELRSSVSSAIDQRGFEIAELWKQHLAQREAEFQKIESELRTLLNASEVKYEQLLENVQSSNQEETNKLVTMEQVNSLQNKLVDKEEHLCSLQNKFAEVMNQLDIFRSEMEDERVGHENKLLEQQEEYEKVIQELTVNQHKNSETYAESFKSIQNELTTHKTRNEELNQLIEELQNKLQNQEETASNLANQLRIKESEIYQKTHDYSIALAERNEEFENVRKQFLDQEKKIEELSYEKESELAILRLKIHEKDAQYQKTNNEATVEKSNLLEELKLKIVECTNLNKQIVHLNEELKTQADKNAEMEAALESQEIELVSLKDEITSLQSSMRASSAKIQKHVSFASDTKLGSEVEMTENLVNNDLLDAVPRAELDLALYMLHQRDVRCEELTMELTQLLEERDTLQLRLSDSLRLNEELKVKIRLGGGDVSLDSSQDTTAELPSFSVEREFIDTHRGQTSRNSSISDPDGEKPKLQAKLTELRSVKHSRDVRLRQDSEQRQLDLRLLQRDVANLPPEAVDQLAQAHHTLSRDSQSTSTVLLNWLRGKSTPKVVHM